jgi:hypothetical protein
MKRPNLALIAALSLAAAGATLGSASAQPVGQSAPAAAPVPAVSVAAKPTTMMRPTHVRIVRHLARLSHKIRMERKEGLITPKRAAYLRGEDRMIRREIRLDKAQNHGKLTRAEYRVVRSQETDLSRQLAK